MCVIIINHQTFKFLIPQHTGTRIFISSEDALSLLLLFAAPSVTPVPPPQFAAGFSPFPALLTHRRRGGFGTGSTPSPGQASQSCCGGLAVTPSSHTWIDGDPSSFLPDPFLVLPDGSNSTCFSHCPNLPVIYSLFCHGQVLTPLTTLKLPWPTVLSPTHPAPAYSPHPHPRQKICHLPLK